MKLPVKVEVEAMVRVRCLVSALALAIIACGSPSERKLVDTIPNNVPMPSYSGTPDTSAQDAGALVKVPLGTSPVRGPSDAWVTMIEFGDFECPACGYEEPILQALLQEYSNDLRLVFKHFPLTDIHPYAQGAAIAAECAGAQGAFWKMHDLLFLNQDALAPDKLPTYAVQAGINATTFEQCLSTQPPRDTVAADVALGDSIRARGTPTFVINGLLIFGDFTRPQLKTMINPARAQAEASGVPRSEYYDTVILSP